MKWLVLSQIAGAAYFDLILVRIVLVARHLSIVWDALVFYLVMRISYPNIASLLSILMDIDLLYVYTLLM